MTQRVVGGGGAPGDSRRVWEGRPLDGGGGKP